MLLGNQAGHVNAALGADLREHLLGCTRCHRAITAFSRNAQGRLLIPKLFIEDPAQVVV